MRSENNTNNPTEQPYTTDGTRQGSRGDADQRVQRFRAYSEVMPAAIHGIEKTAVPIISWKVPTIAAVPARMPSMAWRSEFPGDGPGAFEDE